MPTVHDKLNVMYDIKPYEAQDFEDATLRLRQYPQLIENFTDIITRHQSVIDKVKLRSKKKELKDLLAQVHNCAEFRDKITCSLFLNIIEKTSIDKLTCSGFDEYDGKPCIFISNHRDIVLDDALLCLMLCRNNKPSCDMVIGDNLLVNLFVTDMFKCNGAITVHRNLASARELREETLRLSKYIRSTIENKKTSVWIAQKSGRSKNGEDNTSPAILKMLYLAYREDNISFEDFLKTTPIIPVSVSYQYDPCDVSKSHEEIRKLREEGCYNVYKKKKYEDILDIVRGIRMYKGNVHIALGSQLQSFDSVDLAVRELDRQIHTMYHLWDTNYFAYDYLNKSSKYKDKYSNMNTKAFVNRYKDLKEEVFNFVLNEYANPVVSMEKEYANCP